MKNIIRYMPRSNWRQPSMRVEGITVHYASGRDVAPQYNNEEQLIAILQSYARYHIENIPNDTIAYTYVVDKWGNSYQTRAVSQSYHTGNAWGNTHTIGVLCPLGTAEKPTVQQVLGLYSLLDILRDTYTLPLDSVYGHKELTRTPCPGELMDNVIYYRTDTIPEQKLIDTPIIADGTFVPGWFRVIHNGKATIRKEPNTDSQIILHLPSDYREYIHSKVRGQRVSDSDVWYQTLSDYGKGYIHSSGIHRD